MLQRDLFLCQTMRSKHPCSWPEPISYSVQLETVKLMHGSFGPSMHAIAHPFALPKSKMYVQFAATHCRLLTTPRDNDNLCVRLSVDSRHETCSNLELPALRPKLCMTKQ